MNHWVLVFSPEMYEVVQKKKIIGVVDRIWKSFSSQISVGDQFIAYISRVKLLDSFGVITGEATYETDKAFGPYDWVFPCRRRVSFQKTGLKIPEAGLLKKIQPFVAVNTYPGNYLMLKGGFVKIAKEDYERLLLVFKRSSK